MVRDLGVISSGDRAPETLADSYFVAADRRTLVRDSRDYGPVPRGSIRSIIVRVLSAGDHDAARQGKLPLVASKRNRRQATGNRQLAIFGNV